MRLKRQILSLSLAFAFALCFLAQPVSANEPGKNAEAAVIMDARTRRVLLAQNAHEKLPMASTTKIMTALIALENCKTDEIITVPKEAYGTEGSSMYLNLGEKLTLEDLLYGLMLSSGNDAAVTIAIHIGGTVEGFAKMMNTRAKDLGALNTNFVTPNGLHDENHYTTAYDLALISCAAMEREDFRTLVSTQYYQTKSGDIKRTLKSKNKLLFSYDGGNGIKTGYTKNSGKCLSFSAERKGNTIVGVVLNSPDMWGFSRELLDYGFAEYEWSTVVKAGEAVKNITVKDGLINDLELLAKDDIIIPLKQEENADNVELRVDCPYSTDAPIYAGQAIGKLEAYLDGALMCSTPLVADRTIYKKEFSHYLRGIMNEWIF